MWYFGYSHALAPSTHRALVVLNRDEFKTNNEVINLATNDEDNRLVLSHSKGATPDLWRAGEIQDQPTLIPTEEWVHLVVTYQPGSGKIRIFKQVCQLGWYENKLFKYLQQLNLTC